MSNLHKRERVTERRVRQFRVNPPNQKDGDGQARFTAKLNQQFSLIADELAKVPKFPRGYNIEDYARKEEIEDIIDRIDEQAFDLISSEGDEEINVGGGTRAAQARSSRRRRRVSEAAQAAADNALESARPTVAPPEVEDASNIGTANTPPRFSYEDHTHSGVNLGDAQTITGLKTFDRDPAAPFAVTAGSASVTNLSSDFLDGLDATFFAWLTGQTGGQVLRGGTAAGDDLTLSSTINATKGNVFIGITSEAASYDETNNRLGLAGATPNTRLDIDGDLALRADDETLANGANNDVAIGAFSTIRIVGPTAAFSTTGFASGFDGKVLTVHNTVAFAWTIANLNGGSAAANQIQTLTGADVVLAAGASIATFYYDATQTNWILISARDSTGAV